MCFSLPSMPAGQGAEKERRLGSGCTALRAAGTPRAHPCRPGVPKNTVTRHPHKDRVTGVGTPGKPAALSPAPQTPAASALTVRRDPTQGGHRQPDQRAPQHQGPPAGLRHSGAPARGDIPECRMAAQSTRSPSAGHIPPLPAAITSPLPAPPTPY